MPKIGILVLARMGSRRLPGKALLQIAGKPTIIHLLLRLSRTKYEVIFCIPDLPEDDVLCDTLYTYTKIHHNMKIHRGENDSPLKRLYTVANKCEFDHIVRITHDDILIDTKIMDLMINYHLKKDQDYTYTALIPEGCGCEVMKVEAINRAYETSGNNNIEGVSYYFRNNSYKWDQYITHYAYHHQFRCTLDTPEDYTVLKLIADQLPYNFAKVLALDIIHHLKRAPSILEINKQPMVTIYIVNHNYSKYLKQAIDSALQQTYLSIEIIVIDDASTDDSIEALKDYISHDSNNKYADLKFIFNKKHMGLPASANKAISYARGRYILRIDADDILMPSALEKMVQACSANKDISIMFPGYLEIDEKLIVLKEHVPPFDKEGHHPTCCLIKKRCWEDFKYDENLKGYESYDLFLKFTQKHKLDYYSKSLWMKRTHCKNMSSNNLKEREKIKQAIETNANNNPS